MKNNPLPFSEKLDENLADLDERIKGNKASLLIIDGGVGEGKCFGKGTRILMYDGKIKNVEDIKIGDQIMGNNSTPRTILKLGRGTDQLYRIDQTKGESYTVNSEHILSLKRTRTERYRYDNPTHTKQQRKDRKGEILNISVKEHLKSSKKRLGLYKGYKAPTNFPPIKNILQIPSYFLGLWLGDGTSSSPEITTMDEEIKDYCIQYAHSLGLRISTTQQKNNKSTTINLVTTKGQKNIIKDKLKTYNLINNKHIPDEYKYNSRRTRLELLAGLIDTDGYVNHQGYVFVNKNKQLAEDTCFIARSIGFYSYIKPFINKQFGLTYYKVGISGDCSIIPVKIPRKKVTKRLQKKDVLTTNITITPIGKGEYYGFEIDDNKLFLLGDFTVTHNTTLAVHAADQHNKRHGLGAIKLEVKDHPQIGMGAEEFLRCFKKCHEQKLPVLIYDEAGDFNRRGALTKLNNVLNRTFETFRAFDILIILVLPSFEVIDSQLFDKKIPRLLLHLSGRTKTYGNFDGHSLVNMLYIRSNMKKLVVKEDAFNYSHPNFRGHFKDLEPSRSKALDRISTKSKLSTLDKGSVKLEGLLTIKDISAAIGVGFLTTRKRLQEAKIKPARVISRTYYYPPHTIDTLLRKEK